MKFRRRGVKREHSVLAEYAAVFERLAALPAVEGVIPGRIAQNPTRHPGLVLKTETATGFKLLAKSRQSVQEVFVIVRRGMAAEARAALAGMTTRPAPATGADRRTGDTERRRRGAGPRRTGLPRPGVLPAARWQGSLVRYSAGAGRPDWAPAGAPLGDAAEDPLVRRRLWLLRLRRARWRQRFGTPLRTVPRPPRRGRRRA